MEVKIFRPDTQRALGRWAMLALFIAFIAMPVIYLRQHFRPGHAGDKMPWGFVAGAIGIMTVMFILESKVRKVEIDKASGIISIQTIRYFKTRVRQFPISGTEVSFTNIPGTRGGKTEALRFKDADGILDMKAGFNGWSRDALEEIRNEVSI